VPLAKRFHYNRPPTILDIPEKMAYDAVNIPDPQTPVGAKGVAEAAVGAGRLRCDVRSRERWATSTCAGRRSAST
jgi:hypothetical protein